jgi:excisionase family DNA binding protein
VEPIAVDVQEAARLTSLSPYTVRAYIRQKKLRAVHVGRRLLVPVAELQRLVAEGIESHHSPKNEAIIQ